MPRAQSKGDFAGCASVVRRKDLSDAATQGATFRASSTCDTFGQVPVLCSRRECMVGATARGRRQRVTGTARGCQAWRGTARGNCGQRGLLEVSEEQQHAAMAAGGGGCVLHLRSGASGGMSGGPQEGAAGWCYGRRAVAEGLSKIAYISKPQRQGSGKGPVGVAGSTPPGATSRGGG